MNEQALEFMADLAINLKISRLNIDKEKYELLMNAIVEKIRNRIDKKEDFANGLSIELIDQSIEELKSFGIKISDEEVELLNISLFKIMNLLIEDLHKDNPEHICENCPADYICNPDPNKSKKIEK